MRNGNGHKSEKRLSTEYSQDPLCRQCRFLPGDLQSKVDPYLRPLYDALFDMLGAETYQKYAERGNIEVATPEESDGEKNA